MTAPIPEHLFQQAEKLAQPSSGPPRQADLRRAVSATYYAVFHTVLGAASDYCVGVSKRGTEQYALVYRSISHGWLSKLCDELSKVNLSKKYAIIAFAHRSEPTLRFFAATVLQLQEERHRADYDPRASYKLTDVILLIEEGRGAIANLESLSQDTRDTFLCLTLFQPR